MNEVWKDVVGYEGRYQVSSLGRIQSLRSKNGPRVRPISLVVASDGYLSASLFNGKSAKTFPVHVLVSAAFHGKRPDGLQINHRSGIKTDNRIENLEYCSRLENMRHAFAMGVMNHPVGENHPRAKLTQENVEEIRAAIASGERQATLASRMRVSISTISRIKRGEGWNHLNIRTGG